jgi:hypothetical protein
MSTPQDSLNALFDRVSTKVMQVADERNLALRLLNTVWEEYAVTASLSATTLESISILLWNTIGQRSKTQ